MTDLKILYRDGLPSKGIICKSWNKQAMYNSAVSNLPQNIKIKFNDKNKNGYLDPGEWFEYVQNGQRHIYYSPWAKDSYEQMAEKFNVGKTTKVPVTAEMLKEQIGEEVNPNKFLHFTIDTKETETSAQTQPAPKVSKPSTSATTTAPKVPTPTVQKAPTQAAPTAPKTSTPAAPSASTPTAQKTANPAVKPNTETKKETAPNAPEDATPMINAETTISNDALEQGTDTEDVYEVKSGDNIHTLAIKLKTSVDDLVNLNGLTMTKANDKSHVHLKINQKLKYYKTRKHNGFNNKITDSVYIEALKDKLEGAFKGKELIILHKAKEYNIPVSEFYAIIMHESAKGTSDLIKNKNNPGGIRDTSSSFKSFASLYDGIDAVAKNLSVYYAQKIDTLEKIQPKYCPFGDTEDVNGNNKNWLPRTTALKDDFVSLLNEKNKKLNPTRIKFSDLQKLNPQIKDWQNLDPEAEIKFQ